MKINNRYVELIVKSMGIISYYVISIIITYILYTIIGENFCCWWQPVDLCESPIEIRSSDTFVQVENSEYVTDSTSKSFTFKERIKRRFVWHLFECDKNKYGSYSEFKYYWDPNFKIRSYIKEGINEDLHKFKVQKKTLKHFIGALNPKNVRYRRPD